MDFTSDESAVLRRYRDKTHMAGGAKAGYVLRRLAIERGVDDDVDPGAAIEALCDRGLLAPSEDGSFLFLTEEGVAALPDVA